MSDGENVTNYQRPFCDLGVVPGTSIIMENPAVQAAAAGALDAPSLPGDLTFPLTIGGTVNSGGIPYFSSAIEFSSSATLAANSLLVGGGAGVAPSSITTGIGILAALGINIGSAGAPILFNGAGGTPSSIDLTHATNVPAGSAGTLSGATLASNILASSLTSVGTLTGGATGAGFTIALSSSTVTGTLGAARFPALTGDVTTSAGTVSTTVASIGGKAVTLGAAFTTTGAGATTFALGTSTQTYTFPSATATLAQLGAQTFSGAQAAPSLALGGATIGTDALGVTGTTTLNGDVTVAGAALILSGNQSKAAWTTNGLRLKGVSGTLTDTTSSGTVAAGFTDVLGGNTIAASSATTFTKYASLHLNAPVAGSNVTLTKGWALDADSVFVNGVGSAAAPSLAVGNATTGLYSVSTTGLGLAVNGALKVDYGITTAGSLTVSGGVIATGNVAVAATVGYGLGWDGQNVIIQRAGVTGFRAGSVAGIGLGSGDVAAPIAQFLYTQNVAAGTSNTSGPDLTIAASQGTGTGAGGSILFKTAAAGSTGTAQNALATVLSINSTGAATFTGSLNNQYSMNVTNASNGSSSSSQIVINSGGAEIGAIQGFSSTYSLTPAYAGNMAAVALGSFLFNSDAGVSSGGAHSIQFITGGYSNNPSLTIATGAPSGTGAIVSSPAAANLQFGAGNAASPIAQTLSVQSVVAGTSNTAGAAWTLTGSLSTGSGTSGDIILKTGNTGAGATAQNVATTALTIKGATQRVVAASTISAGSFTVSGLSALTPSAGDMAYVTDMTAPTYLGTLTGGGSVKGYASYNGTAWVS